MALARSPGKIFSPGALVHDLILEISRCGRARRLHRQHDQRCRIIAFGCKGRGAVETGVSRHFLEQFRTRAVGARILAERSGQTGADVIDQLLTDHAVGQNEGVERAGIQRLLDDALAALIGITGDDQNITASRGERRDFGGIVGLAVLMRSRSGAPRFAGSRR